MPNFKPGLIEIPYVIWENVVGVDMVHNLKKKIAKSSVWHSLRPLACLNAFPNSILGTCTVSTSLGASCWMMAPGVTFECQLLLKKFSSEFFRRHSTRGSFFFLEL